VLLRHVDVPLRHDDAFDGLAQALKRFIA
jgi:hypothetical protein